MIFLNGCYVAPHQFQANVSLTLLHSSSKLQPSQMETVEGTNVSGYFFSIHEGSGDDNRKRYTGLYSLSYSSKGNNGAKAGSKKLAYLPTNPIIFTTRGWESISPNSL
jgi:hypothetical protein